MNRRNAIGGLFSAILLTLTAGKAKAKQTQEKSYDPWIGDLDRSKINWGPTVDYDFCIGCGMCMHCGRNVYDWKDGLPHVARYDRCMPGCRTCMNLCPVDAITFPPLEDVKAYLEKEKIYDRIKGILIKSGKIPQDG